ncbi:TlpA family protein disulfide reductase [Mucilaginibacter mali]|uniref:TlpA family protein disulfide reductase n=1 Tax=Mucilaginibacter mali TaxID=2740462 RepID=A0A7D4UD05_9SPHI|nr:TlpA disulfide reductase family protein [Mucilaginibacter mali]QKJ32158.1 TlpA family protein disulfide reductase [Mucilaginibacter mali]
MMSKIKVLFLTVGIFAALLCSCRKEKPGKTVDVKALTVYGDTIYLESAPFEDNPSKKIDSAIIVNNQQQVVWHVPISDEAIYKIRSKKMNKGSYLFVADSGTIAIDANFMSPVFKSKGSPATAVLNKFLTDRINMAESGRQISRVSDSLLKAGASKAKLDSVKNALNQSLSAYFDYSLKFADTVRSPAVFLLAYYSIEFGADRAKLKAFILKSAARFPKYPAIQKLKNDELATMKIYEEEYEVGDKLPAITLPDQNGFTINTSSYNGSYYLIDFWSSWCTQCLPFKEAERNLLEKIPGKIKVVSVAIDSEKEDWSKMVFANQYTWPQLIDVAMWKGTAVQTMKIDSIPFNFLVGPDGKVIAKALNAHNLESTVMAKVK